MQSSARPGLRSEGHGSDVTEPHRCSRPSKRGSRSFGYNKPIACTSNREAAKTMPRPMPVGSSLGCVNIDRCEKSGPNRVD